MLDRVPLVRRLLRPSDRWADVPEFVAAFVGLVALCRALIYGTWDITWNGLADVTPAPFVFPEPSEGSEQIDVVGELAPAVLGSV